MAGIVAKHREQMMFCYSHLVRNIFNFYMRRFFFGLVYNYICVGTDIILAVKFFKWILK